MIEITALIKKFDKKGEKTGWTYIEIPATLAHELKPDCKKTFRVKGRLDTHKISATALLPVGNGDFIMPLNAATRKSIKKGKGQQVLVVLEADNTVLRPCPELLECLQDEPKALAYFSSLPPSHQLYFSRWIEEAKTDSTKARRIAQTLTALDKGKGFSEMLRSVSKNKPN